jgi:ribosomal protein L15E
VTVTVAQRIKLSVRRSGSKVYVKGSLGPKKRRRLIVIQVRVGKRWHKLARVRTSKRSTFKLVRALKPGHVYKFRATTAAYPGLLGGSSRIATLRK